MIAGWDLGIIGADDIPAMKVGGHFLSFLIVANLDTVLLAGKMTRPLTHVLCKILVACRQ